MNARMALVALALAEASMFRERQQFPNFSGAYSGGRMRGGKCNSVGNYKKMIRRRKRKGYSY